MVCIKTTATSQYSKRDSHNINIATLARSFV